MMRGFFQAACQAACVLAIAVGSGLVSFGSKLGPQLNVTDPVAMIQFLNSHEGRRDHFNASLSSGVGMGFLIFGTLGLVVPWVNKLGNSITGELGDNSARTIATTVLWLSVAMILTFGVFRTHWAGAAGMSVLLILVVVLCVAAAATTAMICGWRPWIQRSNISETGHQQAS